MHSFVSIEWVLSGDYSLFFSPFQGEQLLKRINLLTLQPFLLRSTPNFASSSFRKYSPFAASSVNEYSPFAASSIRKYSPFAASSVKKYSPFQEVFPICGQSFLWPVLLRSIPYLGRDFSSRATKTKSLIKMAKNMEIYPFTLHSPSVL